MLNSGVNPPFLRISRQADELSGKIKSAILAGWVGQTCYNRLIDKKGCGSIPRTLFHFDLRRERV
jgi:hypothetical protein